MYNIALPSIAKTNNPTLCYVMLAFVAGAFCGVLYMMLRHQHETRKRKKSGLSPHTGRHGNH